ncbi:MAG: SulP family inorganic anion transporter [Planctomycetaceae bacterium]
MSDQPALTRTQTIVHDVTAGLVVFLVALPLCLGIALASRPNLPDQPELTVPLFAGLLAGIIGGLVVGAISGSHTSVSGPAAGLTAVVAMQLQALGSFEALLLAVFLGGLLQIGMAAAGAGSIAAFFPTSVIKGLLAAIGIILILKQIPHLFGHDTDPEGEMSFQQPDHETTFSELVSTIGDLHVGAATIGIISLGMLVIFGRSQFLDRLNIPAPLVVVVAGTLLNMSFQQFVAAGWLDSKFSIVADVESGTASHLVQVPVANNLSEFTQFLTMADFSQMLNPAVYLAAVTIALVASLETLLNLEAVDKLDPQRRMSPPNRELLAQGVGNACAGMVGGLPVTSVIIRSSVNINAGGRTKLATLVHGLLLLGCVLLLPTVLNRIPLSCLAAILLVTGIKLASPFLVRQMFRDGWNQFIPFAVTALAIVFTNLLQGILIGLGVALAFILHSNLKRPLRRIMEKHVSGDVMRIELANQVSFLNRASIEQALNDIPEGGHVLLDARNTVYLDPDVQQLIHDYARNQAPAHGIRVSLLGFRKKYQIEDQIQYVDYTNQEIQEKLTPDQVLQILVEGNRRFRTGQQLTRNLWRQVEATSQGQFPMAVVLSCIDSRTPAELIFDLGLGDIFSVRVAGNIISAKVLGSMEYGCSQAGSRLVLVLGHTRCGAVTATVNLACQATTARQATGCEHLDSIVSTIGESICDQDRRILAESSPEEHVRHIDDISGRNVLRTVQLIRQRSATLRRLEDEGRIAIVGAMYDVESGKIRILTGETPVGNAE